MSDSLIGFVLGKRGSVIIEIQQMSGAKVVVSPRYIFYNYEKICIQSSTFCCVTEFLVKKMSQVANPKFVLSPSLDHRVLPKWRNISSLRNCNWYFLYLTILAQFLLGVLCLMQHFNVCNYVQ